MNLKIKNIYTVQNCEGRQQIRKHLSINRRYFKPPISPRDDKRRPGCWHYVWTEIVLGMWGCSDPRWESAQGRSPVPLFRGALTTLHRSQSVPQEGVISEVHQDNADQGQHHPSRRVHWHTRSSGDFKVSSPQKSGRWLKKIAWFFNAGTINLGVRESWRKISLNGTIILLIAVQYINHYFIYFSWL